MAGYARNVVVLWGGALRVRMSVLLSPASSTWLQVQEWGLGQMHNLAARLRPGRVGPAHLETGLRGERATLFHLRRLGYTIVASRWTSVKMRGDVDLIGWDGDWLCFVEVKTRTARDLTPAESAVDRDKEQMLRRLAGAYLRAFPEEKRRLIPVRFDVVSVYLLKSGTEFEVFRGAFDFQGAKRWQ
jgi:putative endonuclease